MILDEPSFERCDISVIRYQLVQSQRRFIQVFKGFAFEVQGMQLLPPRLDQVEPAGIIRDETKLDFWPSRRQSELHLACARGMMARAHTIVR
jgi:hypothetical protein